MGLPYKTEDYDEVGGGSGSASTVNDLGGMNFSTLDNNELMKRVDANNVGGSGVTAVETTIGANYNNQIKTFVGSNELASITTAYDSVGNYKNIELLPDSSNVGANGVNIQSVPASTETRVGINVQDPEEALDIEGNIQLRGGAGKIFFKHPSGLQKVELDGDQDGTNGGKFIIKTKVDGGSMTQKLEINNAGATTINGVLSAYGLKTDNPIHMGTDSGATNQGTDSLAIGNQAGKNNQSEFALALGTEAGKNFQKSFAIAIGKEAGRENQFLNCIAIGTNAGQNNQSTSSIAIGNQAGLDGQGSNCVAIGKQAGDTRQPNNTIILNATGNALNTTATNGFYVAPIANGSTTNQLYYNTTTKEITYAPRTTNYAQDISLFGNMRVGNSITGFHNNNTLDQWLPIYAQPADGGAQQLFTTITLSDPSRPIRIDTDVNLLYNNTTIGFRIMCNDGNFTAIVFGSQAWRTSGSDNDTAPYIRSVIHSHGGTSPNLTVSVEAYVRSNSPSSNPYFFINPVIMPPGTIGTCNLLVTEL